MMSPSAMPSHSSPRRINPWTRARSMMAPAISQALLTTLGLAVANAIVAADLGPATIRFLEQRVAQDPSDSVAQNRLAGLSIQRLRETGDLRWLGRALQAA